MNILENNTGTLNEIIFENRNKNYGAYVIRSTYGNTILKSLGITVLIFAAISAMAVWLNNTVEEEEKLDIGTNVIPPEQIYKVEVDITPKAKIETILPKQHNTNPTKTVDVSTNLSDKEIDQKKEFTQTTDATNGTDVKNNNPDAIGDGPETKNSGTGKEPDGLTKSAEPVMAPDIMPSFNLVPFLQKNLRYPEFAREAGISGRVVVTFIIDEEGNIIKATLFKGIGGGCDEEAMRVIKLMPKWSPGMFKGRPVKVSFNQVINFRLQ